MIELSTLGVVEVKDEDGLVVEPLLAQPKRLALLVYLALGNTRVPHRRDSVVALFWPELDQEHARAALRQAVRFLRSHLGERVVQGRTEEELEVSTTVLSCDVRAFDEACETGRPDEALRLYRGAFLNAFHVADVAPEFEQWVDAERARLRKRAAEAAWVLAEQGRAEGDLKGAAEGARRAASLAGDDEAEVRRLITFLAGLGDRAGALHVYADFAARLRAEFDAEPGADTRTLINDVRSREVAAKVGAAFQPPAPRPATHRELARPRWRTVAVAGVVAAGVGAGIVAWGRQPKVIPAASVIAVLPFAPSVPDTALSRLGRDLVLTLSANLDGVGEIRTVDPQTILAQLSGRGSPSSLESGRALGRRFGAGSVVHGSLVRVGINVRSQFGLYTTDSGRVLARVSVTGPADSVSALTDSATWALVREVWRRGTPPTPSLSAVRTRSVPALRAFLEGERAGAENRWRAAAQAYARAIEADSAFWLAYWRYAHARGWYGEAEDSLVNAKLFARRFALPERDRLLVESFVLPGYRVWHERAQEAARRYPDYWPATMRYADALYHVSPLLGYTYQDAREALEQTVALNPNLTEAWDHLFYVTLQQFDTAAAARALQRLRQLGYGLASAADAGADQTLVMQMALQQFTTGAVDAVLTDSLVAQIVRAGTGSGRAWWVHLAWLGCPAAQLDLNQRLERAPSAELRRNVAQAIPITWASRGEWDSALVAEDRYLAETGTDASALDAFRLAVFGAALGGVDPEVALSKRQPVAAAAQHVAPKTIWQAQFAWLDGVLAWLRRDPQALSAARARVQRTGSVGWGVLDSSLAAFGLELSGRRMHAARALAALDWAGAHPFVIGIDRLAAARWFIAEGDTTEAARLLTWIDGASLGGLVVGGLTYLERAKIEDARGRAGLAKQYYRQFLRRYDMPVPTQRQLVEQAKAALARLEGGGPGEQGRAP